MTQQVEKKNLDWANLGFAYHATEYRFRAIYKDGEWSEGEIIEDNHISMHEGAAAIHYAQQCFEGLKAQTAPDGRVLLFRPDLNAKRMNETAERLLMPQVPEELFIRAVKETVAKNLSWVPPHGSGASLYIRPVLMGCGPNLGLRPAPEFEFRVFVSPVGPYYKGDGLSVISLAVTNVDRAAPQGTGHFKAGANYAGGLLATMKAQEMGANEALYLDARERRYLEEAGSANIIVVMKNGALATPFSDAILPSITRRSVCTIAEKELGMKVEIRPIEFLTEVENFVEMGACGTAAVISPVGKVFHNTEWFKFYGDGEEVGPVTQKLYDLLTQLQKGEREDTYGWTVEV